MICEQLRVSARLGALWLKNRRRFADNGFGNGIVANGIKAATSGRVEQKSMSASSRASGPAQAKEATQSAYPLLPGEHEDISVDIRALIKNADQWLAAPNSALGGRTPNECIGTADEQFVRDMLRAAIYSGMA
jgi:Antitoxin Xre/MbcA/ParS C-terminal toxin-binding domain